MITAKQKSPAIAGLFCFALALNYAARKNFTRKSAERKYVTTGTSFGFPVQTLRTVKVIKASPIPCPIEPETGMAKSMMKTGAV